MASNDRCKIFNCDKLHGNYCCIYCDKLDRCKNHCLNSPEKCGQLTASKLTRMQEVANKSRSRYDLRPYVIVANANNYKGYFTGFDLDNNAVFSDSLTSNVKRYKSESSALGKLARILNGPHDKSAIYMVVVACTDGDKAVCYDD